MTDSAISGATAPLKNRVLKKWDDQEETTGPELKLESGAAQWDQFAVNEKLFGVTTDFKEEIYTTVTNF